MKVTVITVVYNSVNTVEDALKSVAEQTHPDIEHIVIDGASDDGTVDVVNQYSSSITHFISEPDKGIYDAMNKGLNLASGDVIGFLNSDDVYANPSVLSDIVALHQDESLDACYANLVYVDDLSDSKIKRAWRSREYEPGLCFKGWMPAHPTLYIKRAMIEKVGSFDITLGNQADLEFCARAFEVHNMSSHYCRDNWVIMRTGGASQASLKSMVVSNWRSYKALKKLGLKRNPVSFFAIKFGTKLPQFFAR